MMPLSSMERFLECVTKRLMDAIAEGEEEPSDENLPEEPSDDDADYNYYIQSAFMSKSYFNPTEV